MKGLVYSIFPPLASIEAAGVCSRLSQRNVCRVDAERRQAAGGRGEIRTHGGLAPTPVFKTGALNHSATRPSWRMLRFSGWLFQWEADLPADCHPLMFPMQRDIDSDPLHANGVVGLARVVADVVRGATQRTAASGPIES